MTRHRSAGPQSDLQLLANIREDAGVNDTSLKWVDSQKSALALLVEVVGDQTPVRKIDYDLCLKVRGVLATLPAGRTKAYSGLSLAETVAQADADSAPRLSAKTQEGYLATFRKLLNLAAKKRLIGVNPADDLKPLKRETVSNSKKRLPFTPVQLKEIFESEFYRAAARNETPYEYDPKGWRFWLPLLSLFMGMRPNETCQMLPADVKCTEAGTWYVDVVDVGEDEDGEVTGKTLKTETSRRRIPIHPQLIAIGFVEFAQRRLRARAPLLFDGIRPDKYGNHAKYVLKRFRELYLPAATTLLLRQSFYSFRHNFRDALRRAEVPPDALQALGGWSQGSLVSDNYGERDNPDYQAQFIRKVSFPGLDLQRLHRSAVISSTENFLLDP